FFLFFQAEDGIRDATVTGVQTCALPIWELLEEAESLSKALQQKFAATAWAMGVSLGQIVTLLAIVLPACHVPSRATIGRWVDQRSEERRVGKEGRSWRSRVGSKKENECP